ncbi:MAG: indolepyruvate oxidoreductase subunit beta [Anaerolineae bacterium CG03_land_8_20_14_0_80_58_20]|nr:MAG: indolepyruvate oxidoreductase subunit beta [Anaerolineae bacterium CG03_land_8_20_14_0_80_58_20]
MYILHRLRAGLSDGRDQIGGGSGMKTFSLMFAGVGGQGSLLIADLTSLAAVSAGYDTKQTEVHGVSQRGGSVETHVRFGEKVHSPIVTPGEAYAVIGLEKLEALRFAHYVNAKDGTILVNDHELIPGSIANAEKIYPHETIDFLKSKGLRVIVLPASQTARELGDGRMANVVLLGALSTLLPIPQETWDKTLRLRIPAKYLEGNLKAFQAGRKMAS